MEESVRQELLAKTKQALADDDWDVVVRLWQPWIEQGDSEAEYQLAYHYLWCTPVDDDAVRDRMLDLLRSSASKDHPDAMWFLARRNCPDCETDPEYERQLLRAGQLGSVHAQRSLGVAYATGDWTGPKDLAEAARWYRLAAEKGEADSQYDLGFMLLLGEGGPKNIEEGIVWLERAAEQGQFSAFRLLADCYENGYCDVPRDAEKAALWRGKVEEYNRLNPPNPSRRYRTEGVLERSSLDCLFDIEGVIGFGWSGPDNALFVSYEPTVITPAQLDQKLLAALSAVPTD